MTRVLKGGATARADTSHALWVAFAAFLPFGLFVFVFSLVAWGDTELIDFHSYYAAAQALLRGESPYPEYVYPPLMAIVSIPLALLPLGLAEAVLMLVHAGCVVLTLRVLGVRDWRCYGLAFLWPPVIAAIQTGNVTIPLGLCAAVAWRYRERPVPPSTALGLSLAAKFFLWPLLVWLVAARRFATAALATAASAAFLFLSWAAIGFSGIGDYWGILRHVQQVVQGRSLTAYVFALDLGASPSLARAIWLLLGVVLLGGCLFLGHRGDERGAFVLAISASLALTPIVWLHYFVLLLVAVAVASPALGAVWFVPLAMYVTPGSGDASPAVTLLTLAAAAVTVALCIRSTTASGRGPTKVPPIRVSAA